MYKEELTKYIAHPQNTILQVMQVINENWCEIALIADDDFHLLGVITDGDIRRGLLQGLGFNAHAEAIMSKNFMAVSSDVDRAAVLDMMKAHTIRQMPIVDHDRKLIGIHSLQELIGASKKPNIAVIMAGGKGTRLKPLTETCPKPMISVAGRPILERVILHLVSSGIRTIYIAINYLGEMIEEYFGDGTNFGCSIQYLKEQTPLGTGGALSLLPKLPKHPFIVMNGDLITQVNFEEMLHFHTKGNYEATIGAHLYQIEIPFGVIVKNGNRLLEIQEKPTEHYLINSGIYVLNPSVIKFILPEKHFPMTYLFDSLLDKKLPVGIHVIEDEWIDVGRHEELWRANGFF